MFIYSASFWISNCRFHFGKTRKPCISMCFGPSARDHDSQNQLLITLETARYSKTYKKITKSFFSKDMLFRHPRILHIETVRKDLCRNVLKIRLILLISLNTGSISARKHKLVLLKFQLDVFKHQNFSFIFK